MAAIHFVDRLDNVQLVDEALDEWESGYWAITPDCACKLLGGGIYLHRGQLTASFLGGIIVGFRVIQFNHKDRFIFRFKKDPSHIGVLTEKQGWGNEQKRVW